VGFFSRVDFKPLDAAFSAVDFFDRRVEDQRSGSPDVGTGAVAFDKGNDRMIADPEFAALNRDFIVAGVSRQKPRPG
jgi:hypothetical protein